MGMDPTALACAHPLERSRPERVLIVDDEPVLAAVLADAFRERGFDVDEVREVAAATELALSRGYDLIIADLGMPGGGARRLHRVLADRRPELAARMLLVTGDAPPEPDEFPPGVICVEKPFTAIALAEAALDVIGRRRS
jgi:DNA-binding response OmpR family regulator